MKVAEKVIDISDVEKKEHVIDRGIKLPSRLLSIDVLGRSQCFS